MLIIVFWGHQRTLNYKTFEYFLNFNHFTLLGENDPPVIAEINKAIDEDNLLTFTKAEFIANYSDSEGNPFLTFKPIDIPDNGQLSISGSPLSELTEISSDDLDNMVFRPDDNWNGATQLLYLARDGHYFSKTLTINITVNPINDKPIFQELNITTLEDTNTEINQTMLESSFLDFDTAFGNCVSVEWPDIFLDYFPKNRIEINKKENNK